MNSNKTIAVRTRKINVIERSKIDLCISGQLILTKAPNQFSEGKESFLTHGAR